MVEKFQPETPQRKAASENQPVVEQYFKRLIDAIAKNLGVTEVNKVYNELDLLQYKLTQETNETHSGAVLESNSPYIKILAASILTHERVSVIRGIRSHPEQPLQFRSPIGRLEKQWQKRLSTMVELLENPDGELAASFKAMRSVFSAIDYSPSAALEDVANYQNEHGKFHVTLQPSPQFILTEYDGVKSATLVMGLNVIATTIVEKIIFRHLVNERALCKLRPTGLVIDGPKSLQALEHILVSQPEKFKDLLDLVEANYKKTRQWEK